jgi:site-specific recombinase XerD
LLYFPRNHEPTENDLIFTNDRGNPLSNSNFRSRIYDPAVAKAGLSKITIHDLRHTAASIAINNGAKITSVSNMLGHSDISMTLKVYSHFYDEDLKELAKSIEFEFVNASSDGANK